MCDTAHAVISTGREGSLIDLAGTLALSRLRSIFCDHSFAISRRSRCGVRGWPVLSSHFCPAPQVGNGRRVNLSGLVLLHGLEIATRASTLRMVNFEQCSGRGFRTVSATKLASPGQNRSLGRQVLQLPVL